MNKMLDDFEASIKHINEKTTELGYHVNKLALSNASDGGHLSMLYTYLRAESSPNKIY